MARSTRLTARKASGTPGRDENAEPRQQDSPQGRLFPVPPADTQQDIRTEMVLTMEELGVKVEKQHHEVATAGQAK